MRRLLALVLLCLSALQPVWALAAAYCQHEARPAGAHFGHHSHVHGDAAASAHDQPEDQPDAPRGGPLEAADGPGLDPVAVADPVTDPAADPALDAADAPAGSILGQVDLDCHACNMGMASVLPVPAALPQPWAGQRWPLTTDAALPAPPPSTVERPNWRARA